MRGVERVAPKGIGPAAGRTAQCGAAQQRLDTGRHFRPTYRLEQTIVGARMKCCDNLTFMRHRHQHDDRQVRQNAARPGDDSFGRAVACPTTGQQETEELAGRVRKERLAGDEGVRTVATGENHAVDRFRVARVRPDEGDSYGTRFQRDGRGRQTLRLA